MEHATLAATVALADALGRGDAVAAAELYAEDGRLLTAAAELITGRRQIEAYWRAGIAFGLAAVELEATDLQVSGRTAIEVGRYVLELRGDGGAVSDRGKYVVLHRRQPNGTWVRAAEVFNPDEPASARRDPKEEQ